MEISINNSTRYVLNYIGKDKLSEIEDYISKVLQSGVKVFKNNAEVLTSLNDFLNQFYEKTDNVQREIVKRYTGINFREINSVLRGIWDYEKNGVLTEKIKQESREFANNLQRIIQKAPTIPFSMSVYRGVGISTFYSYGITNLEDLSSLKGQYMYEEGFISTSLLRTNSFYSKQPAFGSLCNIEIECVIPSDSDDGIVLIDSELSYSPTQLEFLINCSSLFKIIDVEINENANTAKIKTILIPEKIWNPLDYETAKRTEKSY